MKWSPAWNLDALIGKRAGVAAVVAIAGVVLWSSPSPADGTPPPPPGAAAPQRSDEAQPSSPAKENSAGPGHSAAPADSPAKPGDPYPGLPTLTL